jgi:phenylalanyl-tRNA synthetase beta chain
VFLGVAEDARTLLRRLGVAAPRVRPTGPVVGGSLESSWVHPGRSTAIEAAGGVVVGVVGEVHPRVAKAFGVSGRAAAAEIDLARVLATNPSDPPYGPPPRFPTSTFDVAVVVPERTPVAEVEAALRGSAKEAVRSVRLFDAYAGKGIPEGARSLAFTVEFGAEDATLAPKTVEALQKRAIGALERRGWTVRTGEAKGA